LTSGLLFALEAIESLLDGKNKYSTEAGDVAATATRAAAFFAALKR